MKRPLSFLKSTLLGGVFVLLPIVLLYRLLAELLGLAVSLATPLADIFPEGTFDQLKSPTLWAVALLAATAFALGVLMRFGWSQASGHWLERHLLLPLPGYRAIKSLTRSLGNPDEADGFKPALLVSAGGQKEIAYLIEDHGDGQATVMLPWSPTPMAGSVKVVRRDQVELLPARLTEVTRVLSHWGVGTQALLHPSHASGNPQNLKPEA